MSVKQKGKSEYQTHYKWLESFRSKSYKPSAEQMAPRAGTGSVFSSISYEPALQHKRRVEGPPTSLSLNNLGPRPASDEYALLGQQGKFAPSVCYKPKGTSTSAANPALGVPKAVVSKDISPAKQRKLAEIQKNREKEEPLTPSSPPPAPRTVKGAREVGFKEGLRDKNLSDVLQKPGGTTVKESTKPVKGTGQAMNEFVQTDLKKGVALSGQEATADYSLKYKAGIAPARYSKRSSEYQKEFGWKKGVPASPLLTAEQVVYNSNPQVSPCKKLGPSHSEYRLQFQAWPVPRSSISVKPQLDHEQLELVKQQKKRSKSVEATRILDCPKAAGSPPVTSPEDPRLLQESKENVPVPPLSHGKLKQAVTEYRANFAAPTRYSYDQGAWRGAFPAHLLRNQRGPYAKAAEQKANDDKHLSNWFAEVLELRRRANEYKRRAQGTHFSREHLVQLLAQQTGYWDIDSARSAASLDALALEPGPAALPLQQRQNISAWRANDDGMADAASHMAVRGDFPDPAELDTPKRGREKQRRFKTGKKVVKSRRTAWAEEKEREKLEGNVKAGAVRDDSAVSDEGQRELNAQEPRKPGEPEVNRSDLTEVAEGRLPTPVLREKHMTVARHHLDLTTPSFGGVLLSSGDQKKVLTCRSDDSYVAISEEHNSPKQDYYTTTPITSPLLGKPTPDTHPLRDEEASTDHVMDTEYIASPPLPDSPPIKKRTANRKSKKSQLVKPSLLSTVDEEMGKTYRQPEPSFKQDEIRCVSGADDDTLSVSAMSIASSSSLASQVYERARRRRDEFWGPSDGEARC